MKMRKRIKRKLKQRKKILRMLKGMRNRYALKKLKSLIALKSPEEAKFVENDDDSANLLSTPPTRSRTARRPSLVPINPLRATLSMITQSFQRRRKPLSTK